MASYVKQLLPLNLAILSIDTSASVAKATVLQKITTRVNATSNKSGQLILTTGPGCTQCKCDDLNPQSQQRMMRVNFSSRQKGERRIIPSEWRTGAERLKEKEIRREEEDDVEQSIWIDPMGQHS